MSRLTSWIDNTFYPGSGRNWDDDIFRGILEEKISSATECLEYGAGRGNVTQMNFKSIAKSVAGVDIDEAVFENPHLNESRLIDLRKGTIPYEDNKFDVVFSTNVLEHVQDPATTYREVFRVLKPGGVFLSKTPNKFHYMPLVASVTPTKFHTYYNKLRGRKELDTFPTAYKSNTRSDVTKLANDAGFEVQYIRLIEGRPEYLRLTTLTYLPGILYERTVNLTERLAAFRCVMIFELKKNL